MDQGRVEEDPAKKVTRTRLMIVRAALLLQVFDLVTDVVFYLEVFAAFRTQRSERFRIGVGLYALTWAMMIGILPFLGSNSISRIWNGDQSRLSMKKNLSLFEVGIELLALFIASKPEDFTRPGPVMFLIGTLLVLVYDLSGIFLCCRGKPDVTSSSSSYIQRRTLQRLALAGIPLVVIPILLTILSYGQICCQQPWLFSIKIICAGIIALVAALVTVDDFCASRRSRREIPLLAGIVLWILAIPLVIPIFFSCASYRSPHGIFMEPGREDEDQAQELPVVGAGKEEQAVADV